MRHERKRPVHIVLPLRELQLTERAEQQREQRRLLRQRAASHPAQQPRHQPPSLPAAHPWEPHLKVEQGEVGDGRRCALLQKEGRKGFQRKLDVGVALDPFV
eukprot:scaffold133532_cov26-Tisochrysis_lutea.AAC.7